MRHLRTAILAGAAVLLVAGVAEAATAKFHHMNVTLPDGSVAHIEYVGKVAPKVIVEPAAARRVAVVDPFLRMDRIMASMEARHRAMLAQMAALEQTASQQTAADDDQLVASSNVPAGAHYTMMSTTTDANGCTRTVEYRSSGNNRKPQVTRTSSGNCGRDEKAKPESAPQPAAVPPLSDQV